MGTFDPQRFANDWIAAWNALDVDGVVSHFAERCEFRSPRAQEVTGSAAVQRRDALRAYWTEAARRATSLHFTLDRVLWNGADEVVILYDSRVGERRRRACEFFLFDPKT